MNFDLIYDIASYFCMPMRKYAAKVIHREPKKVTNR